MSSAALAFGQHLKSWRNRRKVSQLHLALNASVSQRHVSWLETGKSKPSRSMVLQLAEALDVPLRERNILLDSAGFAPLYKESGLDLDTMEPVRKALSLMLQHHEPMPAMVLDRLWNIVMTNTAAQKLLELLPNASSMWEEVDPSGKHSLARLTLHPKGLRPYIANWSETVGMLMHRLRRDSEAAGSEEDLREYQSLLSLLGPSEISALDSQDELLPFVPLVLEMGPIRLELFSVIATFGTPQDITLDELRIESFFAVDSATREFFAAL